MKTKKSIIGVLLSVVLIAGLILSAVPVAADPGTISYSTIGTPNHIYKQIVAGGNIGAVALAPDGQTMFAYDNQAGNEALYKSSNAGMTWTGTNIGTNLNTNTVVAMAVSPNYATDTTVVAATATKVFRSTNGGASFAEVSTALLESASGIGGGGDNDTITSIDISPYYLTGQPAILVGTADPDANAGGGVFLCRLDTFIWSDTMVGNVAANSANSTDVYAVAFSQDHTADGQILAVGVFVAGANDDTTFLMTKFAANAWGADVLDARIGGTTSPTAITEANLQGATIAFPDDYEWSSANKILVGIDDGAGTAGDVYRVHGGLPGGSSVSYDLNVNGTSADADIHSIATSGSMAGANVIVGQQDSTTVKRTSDPTVSTVTWSSSVKSPIGDATNPNTMVIMAPDFATSNTVFAATSGTNSCLSKSTDGGIYFNAISLINVSATTNLCYTDSDIVDANTMFLLIQDDRNNNATVDAGDTGHLFKTTDGGSTWTRVFFAKTAAAEYLMVVDASPEYAADMTIYAAQNDSRIWKSTDGGNRFIGLAAPMAITAFAAVDGSTYFTGHNAKMYKSGHWNSADVTGNVKSIAISPDFDNDDTVMIGTDAGDIYLSTNASASSSVKYTRQGAANSLGATNNVVVAFHPDFATNSTIFAGSDGTAAAEASSGVFRFVVGTSLGWSQRDAGAGTGATWLAGNRLFCTGIAIAPDGTLYAASADANAGIRRSINPTSAFDAYESMTQLLPTGAMLHNLAYLPGSNVLYAIASGTTSTTYPHGYQLLGYTDTFSITPTLIEPADAATVGGTVTLSWEAIPAPSGTTVTYTIDVATDSAFAAKVVNGATTTGVAYRASGLTAGLQYWWRVYVAAGAPLATQKAVRTMTVRLGSASQDATLSSPAPGSTGAALAPNFQWSAVSGATGYQIQVADNPGFSPTLVSKLIDTNVYQFPEQLAYSTTYYWRVKAIASGIEGPWSVGVFTTMDKPAPPPPPQPTPTITVPPQPTPTFTVTVPPATQPPVQQITPAWIYAIIIVGGVLVIAVIVLIVRTRRVV